MSPEDTGVAPPTTELSRTPESRDSRKVVLDAFQRSLTALEPAAGADLSPEEAWIYTAVDSAIRRIDSDDKDTYVNEFTDPETGIKYSQEEGIPVDRLIKRLREKAAVMPDGPEKSRLQKDAKILEDNSRPYAEVPGREDPAQLRARTQQEAVLISGSEDFRKTDSEEGDWYAAERELADRRELVLPGIERRAAAATRPDSTEVTEEADSEATPTAADVTPLAEVEDEYLTLHFGNRTEDIRKRSREEAELAVREEQRRGKWYDPRGWFRKVKMRVGEEYYRQKYTERLVAAKLEHSNSFLTMDVVKNAAVQATNRIDEERAAGKAKIGTIESGVELAGQRVENVAGPLKTRLINEFVKPMIDGSLAPDQVQVKMRQFVIDNQTDPQIQAMFGHDATQYGRLAEYFVTDLEPVVEKVKEQIAANRYSLDQLDEKIKVKLFNSEWAASSQANFNYVDKMVRWTQSKGWRGWLVNPATLGAAASLVTFAGIRATGVGAKYASWIVPGAGLIVGAGVAAARRNYDLKVDMAAHRTEKAYGWQTPPKDAKRREALDKFTYNTATVHELVSGGGKELVGGGNRQSMESLLTSDLEVEANQDSLIRRMAEIQARLDYSSLNRVDLIQFTSGQKSDAKDRFEVEQGRLKLVQQIIEGRNALKAAGLSDADIKYMENAYIGEWSYQFNQDQREQDRRFAIYRLRNSVGAGVFGGVAGLAAGLVTQEGTTLGMRGIENLSGGRIDLPTGRTAIEKGLESVGILGPENPKVPAGGVTREMLVDLFNKPGTMKISDQIYLNVDGHTPNLYNASFADIPNYARAVPHTLEMPSPPTHLYETPPLRVGPGWIEMSGSQADQQTISKLPGPLKELLQSWTIEENVKDDERYNIQHKLTEVLTSGKSQSFAHGNLEVGYGDLTNPGSENPTREIKIRLLQDHLENPNIRYSQADGEELWGKVKPEFESQRQHAILLTGTAEMTNNGPVVNISPAANAETFTRVNPDGTKISDVILREMAKDQWQIKGDPSFDRVFNEVPPKAMRLTPPIVEGPEEAIPLIPIPFAPRHPLEQMEIPNDVYYGYNDQVSPERAAMFARNRSQTLKENPNAVLDPYQEVENYFNRQNPEYLDEIKSLAGQIPEAPSNNLKAVVAIPVAGHEEGEHIYQTLLNYSQQTASPDQYEIMLFVNHPEGTNLDQTQKEIDRFRSDHPEIPIRTIYKRIPKTQAKMAVIRKYLNDAALYRHHQRGTDVGDIILISNDADLKGVAPQYIENFINKFEINKQADGMVGQLDWDPASYVEYPAIHAGTRLFQYINMLLDQGQQGNRASSGANFAFKGSIYAGIGGYQVNDMPGAEDVILGQAIRAARGNNRTITYAGARVSRIYTSSRRAISAWLQGFAPIEQWDRNWGILNEDIRRLTLGEHQTKNYDDPTELAKLKADLEKVIDKTLDYYRGENENKETDIFKKAVGYLGIRYQINQDGKVEIVDMSRFVKGIKDYQDHGIKLQREKSGQPPEKPLVTTESAIQPTPTSFRGRVVRFGRKIMPNRIRRS